MCERLSDNCSFELHERVTKVVCHQKPKTNSRFNKHVHCSCSSDSFRIMSVAPNPVIEKSKSTVLEQQFFGTLVTEKNLENYSFK